MDSLFIDTLRIYDTIFVYDTVSVKIAENTNSLIYWLKLLAPFSGLLGGILGAMVGSYFGYRFALKKDREIEEERLSDIKEHLFHSINLLINACQEQSRNIRTFAEELKEEVNQVIKHFNHPDFHMNNIDAIKINDIFKIFITQKKGSNEKKSDIYNKLNLSFIFIRDVINHYEDDIFELNKESVKDLEELTSQTILILKAFNDFVTLFNSGSMSLREREFVVKGKKVREEADAFDTTNIYIQKRELIDKLQILAQEYQVRIFIELLSKFKIDFNNFVILRMDFREKFLIYSENLNSAHSNLIFVKEEYEKL